MRRAVSKVIFAEKNFFNIKKANFSMRKSNFLQNRNGDFHRSRRMT